MTGRAAAALCAECPHTDRGENGRHQTGAEQNAASAEIVDLLVEAKGCPSQIQLNEVPVLMGTLQHSRPPYCIIQF